MRIRRVTLTAAALTGLVIGATFLGLHDRSGVPLLPGPARRQAEAEAKLRVVLPAVRFVAAPLDQAVDELRQRTGATFVVDWDALDAEGVSYDDPVDLRLGNVTLEQTLTALVGFLGGGRNGSIQYTLFDGAIVITTDESAGKYAYAAVYDLSDLDLGPPPPVDLTRQGVMPATSTAGLFGNLPNPPPPTRADLDDSLTSLIQETVAPDSWLDAGGNCGLARTFSGRTLVVTTWQNHRQVHNLVSQLRNPSH